MVKPGTAESTLLDPVTRRRWAVTVGLDGTRLDLRAVDAPAGVSVWLRGLAGPDRDLELPAGDSSVTIDISDDGR